ncbi:hypothetical protein Holit_02507 [Hollandina sp. SP2]
MINRTGIKNRDFDSPFIRRALTAVSFIGIAGCSAVLIPAVRSPLIRFGETLMRRQLNHEIWNYQMVFMACAGLLVSISLLCILSKKLQGISIPAEQKNKFYTGGMILLIGAFSGALIFLAASNKSIWVDEAYSLAPIKHSWKEILLYEKADVHPPLFFLFEKAWSLIFGDGIFAMKCLSILPVVVTMLVTTWFLRKEFSDKAAVLFLLCFIASETMVHYSIEIRMYSWALCFITLAALCGWFIIKRGTAIWWGLFILCAEAAAYTHYYAAAIAAIGYAGLLFYILKYDRKNTMKALVSALAGVLVYLPWLPTAINSFTRASENFWIPPLQIRDIIGYGYMVFAAGNRIVALVFLGLFFLVFCRFMIEKNKTKQDGFAFGGLSCIILLAVIGILIALFIRPLLQARYLFPGCGLVWLFFAIEGASIKRKRVFVFLWVCLLAVGIITWSSSIYKERKEHQDFMRFYTYMSEQIQPDDIFIFPQESTHLPNISAYLFPGHRMVWNISLNNGLGNEFQSMFNRTLVDLDALSDRVSDERAWLILSERDEDSPNDFVPPSETQAQWRGLFGWGFYQFNLYRLTNWSLSDIRALSL